MIEVDFKHLPEEVWTTLISPDESNDGMNMYRILQNIDQVKSIHVTNISRHLIKEHFQNIPMPTTMPLYLFYTGAFAQQVLGQLINMALQEEPFLQGYFPLKKQ